MAQMQNRRKLMPDDVVEVCTMKQAFMFLKADLIDLRRAQQDEAIQKEKENGKDKKSGAKVAGDDGAVNTLESYFGKVRNQGFGRKKIYRSELVAIYDLHRYIASIIDVDF